MTPFPPPPPPPPKKKILHLDEHTLWIFFLLLLLPVAEIASEAYVYFYPIFVNTIALYFNSIWPHEPDYFGINVVSPINNGEILDWTFPAEHDSSAEQLYTRTWLDLERPVVFNIPSIVPQPVGTLRQLF